MTKWLSAYIHRKRTLQVSLKLFLHHKPKRFSGKKKKNVEPLLLSGAHLTKNYLVKFKWFLRSMVWNQPKSPLLLASFDTCQAVGLLLASQLVLESLVQLKFCTNKTANCFSAVFLTRPGNWYFYITKANMWLRATELETLTMGLISFLFSLLLLRWQIFCLFYSMVLYQFFLEVKSKLSGESFFILEILQLKKS